METYRVFVSSPGDALRERQRVERVVERLNGEFSALARLVAIRWENSFYQAHATFQTQIPHADACEIVVAVFRGRLGTELPPDFEKMSNGEPYPSGTAYEVLTAIDKRRRGADLPDVYVFRCPNPPIVQLDDEEGERTTRQQWERLKSFFSRFFITPEGHFKAAFQTFSTTDEFEAQLERLLRDWLSRKVTGRRAVNWPIATKGSPFPGLAAYDAAHAAVFFGRSRDVARALDSWQEAAARGAAFLLIVGASGAGKSSLLRAGLAPRLTTPGVVGAVDCWRMAELRPTEGTGGPIAALAAALMGVSERTAGPRALPEIAEGAYGTPREFASLLAHADAASVKPVIEALNRVAERFRNEEAFERKTRCDLVLLVDQLDEVFAISTPADERARFGKLLIELIATQRVWIAATLRADLYELLLREPSLFALKEKGSSYDLAPPGLVEIAEIVRKPAKAAGLVFEHNPTSGETLDEQLLRDADRPDMLPLLQLALSRLFDARDTDRDEPRLTYAAYASLGGLSGIIDRAGEDALQALDHTTAAQLPRLLRHLAEPSRGGTDAASLTTCDAHLAQAAPDEASRALVAALIEARLLQSRSAGGETVIRLAHQRVLTDWARAKAIVDDSAEFYKVREEIDARRRAYEVSGRRPELLLARGLPLAAAEEIVRRYYNEVSSEARAFVRASRRRANRAQLLVGIAACLFAIVAIAAASAAWEARRQQRIATANLAAAESAVHGLTFEIAQGLRDVAGLRAETVRNVLERVRHVVYTLGKQAESDPVLVRDRAAMLNEFVRTYFAVGDLRAAEQAARESLSIFGDLSKRRPEDRGRSRDLMLAINELGVVESGLGDRSQAQQLYERALPMARELVRGDPQDTLAQGDLALSLERIGGVRLAGGDRAGAQMFYEESIGILRALMAREPAQVQWQLGLSDVLDGEASVLLAGGDKQGALAAYEQSVGLVRSLANREPDNSKWATTLAARLGELGTLRLQTKDVDGALGAYDEARSISRRLVARDSDNMEWARSLAVILNKFADAKLAANDQAAAIAAYEQGLAIDRALATRDPTNADWRRGVSIALERIGDLKRESGDLVGARAAYDEMLTIRRALLAIDPAGAEVERDLAIALQRLADVENDMGDAAKALPMMEESIGLTRGLVAKDIGNAGWQLDLASSLTDLGDMRRAAGDSTGALAAYEEGASIARANASQHSDDVEWRRNLAVNLQRIGDLELRSGDLVKARSAFEESLALHRAIVAQQPDDRGHRRDLVLALNRIGDVRLEGQDVANAGMAYAQALALARALATVAPDDPAALAGLAESLEKTAHFGTVGGDKVDVAAAFQEAAGLRRRLLAARSSDAEQLMALVRDLRQVGNARYLAGRYAQAADGYAELVDVLRGHLAHSEDDALRAELATALDRMAATRSAMNDAPDALAARVESLAIRRSLLARSPADIGRQRDLLMALDGVSGAKAQGGDLTGALAAAGEGVTMARGLASASPEDLHALGDLAASLDGLAYVETLSHDYKATILAYQEAIAIRQRLSAAGTDDDFLARGLATDMQQMGNAHYLLGDYSSAATAYGDAIEFLRQRIARQADNPKLRLQLAFMLDRLASARVALQDQTGELTARRESLAIEMQLLTHDPDDVALQDATLGVFDSLVKLLVTMQGSGTSNAEAIQEAMAGAGLLMAAKPEVPRRLGDLALRLGQIGALRESGGNKAGAGEAYGQALALCRRLVALEPMQASWQMGLAMALVKVGMLSGDRVPDLGEALDIMRRLAAANQLNGEQKTWIGMIEQELAKAQASQANAANAEGSR
jgi:eukaryotic-like serine/threonine-protein kinase